MHSPLLIHLMVKLKTVCAKLENCPLFLSGRYGMSKNKQLEFCHRIFWSTWNGFKDFLIIYGRERLRCHHDFMINHVLVWLMTDTGSHSCVVYGQHFHYKTFRKILLITLSTRTLTKQYTCDDN